MTVMKHPTGPIPSVSGQSGSLLSTNGSELVWSAPSSGGMTLIATGTGTGSSATITFSSIPSTYKHLMVVFEEARAATGGGTIGIRFNSTASGYDYRFGGTDTTNDWNASTLFTFYTVATSAADSAYSNGAMWIFNYANSQNKTGTGVFSYGTSGGSTNGFRTGTFRWRNSAAINQISFTDSGSSNFSTSTIIKLYGVS